MTNTAIVIGAGAAGLATAGLLARKGYRVTVLEKNKDFGGRAGSLAEAGFRWDTGPSWYLMPDAFERYFSQMGTSVDEELTIVPLSNPAYRVFPERYSPIDVPAGKQNVVELFESIEPGAGLELEKYLASAEFAYNTAFDNFLYTTFSKFSVFLQLKILSNISLLATLLLTPLENYVNRRFKDIRLRQILSYPAVFLSSRPDKVPALYHLMSHTDLTLGVGYPMGGFHAIIQSLHRLAVKEGVEFRFSSQVTNITVENGQTTGVVVDGEHIHADVVVSCADLHHTETQLLPEEFRTYPADWFNRRDPGIGTVLVMLGIRGSLPELAHHNLFFSDDWIKDFDALSDSGDWSRSIYVCKPSATDPAVAPTGCENLFLLIPVAADSSFDKVKEASDSALELIALRAGIDDLQARIVARNEVGPADFAADYNAWSGGSIGPGHSLKQSAFFRGRNKSKKVERLYYAGATTVPGVGIPLCLISAENVLERLDDDL